MYLSFVSCISFIFPLNIRRRWNNEGIVLECWDGGDKVLEEFVWHLTKLIRNNSRGGFFFLSSVCCLTVGSFFCFDRLLLSSCYSRHVRERDRLAQPCVPSKSWSGAIYIYPNRGWIMRLLLLTRTQSRTNILAHFKSRQQAENVFHSPPSVYLFCPFVGRQGNVQTTTEIHSISFWFSISPTSLVAMIVVFLSFSFDLVFFFIFKCWEVAS